MIRRECFAVLGWVLVFACASAARAEDAGNEFFEKKIRPLLAAKCYECHGPETQEKNLRLDKAAEMFAGGKSGPVISPGKPDGSLLITAVRYTNEELQMPPEKKLAAEDIADLVRWVEIGAPHPERSGDIPSEVQAAKKLDWQKREEHWAFRGPVLPPIPLTAGDEWSQTPTDSFILSRLKAANLEPAKAADRGTLIRRVTFGLTGLPPTPSEIEAFLTDDSSDAFARVIDRLLASPAYGERWGRHWLDVARYADSNGLDENLAHGNAWRYRDWVIDAFNRDLPFADFARQQIAGDLLPTDDPAERNRRLIATGFLALGPKVLAEVDQKKMEMDIIDEQIDTLGRSFLGLTLGCARCHDHKFDPISTRDYYALAGVFKSTHTMDSFAKIAKWYEHPLHSAEHELALAEHRKQVEAKQQAVKDMVAAATAELQKGLSEGATLPEKPEEAFPPETKGKLKQLREEVAVLERKAPVPPSAMGVREEKPVDVAIHVRGSHLTQSEVVPRGLPVVLIRESPVTVAPERSGRLAVAEWLARPDNPLAARVMVNRVWRWHFGRGLVETTDSFGLLGTQPSHPELLDYLATEFARHGSLKDLHRQIMTSAVYQTSSNASPAAITADPENRLLGRTNLRRLEAEEIRDALLAVSGTLDPKRGGPALTIENRKHIFDHTSKDETTYVNNCRTVYLPIVRNHLHEIFTLFDYADASVPNGNRNTSTVASQALYLLNGDFAAKAAEEMAKGLREPAHSDDERIQLLYLRAYGRPANEFELARSKTFLDSLTKKSSAEQAWQLLCHSVLISNEFLYVR